MALSTRPCGQRRARSGRLRGHGHRAPSLDSVRMAPSGSTNNRITHKGLEQEKLQRICPSAFGALTPGHGLLTHFSLMLAGQESHWLGHETSHQQFSCHVLQFSDPECPLHPITFPIVPPFVRPVFLTVNRFRPTDR